LNGAVIWFTGLPSSGKSSLATSVATALAGRGVPHALLDGDAVRAAISPAPGYTTKQREDFYRTLAQLAALLASQGLVVLVPATAHRRAFRDRARKLSPRFVEVFVDTPLAECARRNSKKLYGVARALPGAGVKYQRPLRPEVRVEGGAGPAAVRACLAALRRAGR
jgi:adenylylsulfate kinase